MCVYVCVFASMFVCMCARADACVCVRAYVCVCVCEREREGGGGVGGGTDSIRKTSATQSNNLPHNRAVWHHIKVCTPVHLVHAYMMACYLDRIIRL